MVTIVNISATRFTLNGIPYYKNYISKVAGNRVIIFNAYDYRDVLVEYTSFDEFIVNGGTFASSQLLQNALISTLYTRAGTDGGANEFTELSDTPNSYTGQAGKVVKVNSTEDGLEFDDATGAVGTLQQVLQQGPEANIDTGDGISFSAKMPYFDGSGIDKFFSLVMAYENAGISFSSGLYGEAGLTQLNSQAGDATSSRIVQIGAPIPSPTEGEFNNILLAILQRIVTPGTTIDSSYNITYPTPVEGTSVIVRFPHSLVSAIFTLASESFVDQQITELIDGAPVDANTLKRLNDKILALQAIISGTNPDGDSIVNTIAELLAVFQNYPEGTDIAQILADKVNVADVVNNLTTVIAGKVLDARQGKALADLIAAKWTAVLATNLQAGIMKLYALPGDNTDGAITQKLFNDTVLSKKGIENANYQILATDKWVHTLGNFSANRTFTLPGDAPQGKEIIVADEQGTVGAFTLTISAPAGKQLNGVTNGTEVIQSAYGWRRFVTDGNGNWFFDAGIVRQSQFNLALQGKANTFFNVKIPTTAYVTGTTVETEVYRLEIPANTLSAIDMLFLRGLIFQKLGTAAAYTIRTKLSTSPTMPSGTTDQIGTTSPTNTGISAFFGRGFAITGGNLIGLTATLNSSFETNTGNALLNVPFDHTITQYLYISITLGNVNDQFRVVGGQISNV